MLQFHGHKGPVRCLAFAPDGTRLASGCDDTTVRLWDLFSGQCLKTFPRHAGPVTALDFHPEGTEIAAGGPSTGYAQVNNVIKFWDPDSQDETETVRSRLWDMVSVIDRPSLVWGSAYLPLILVRYLPDGDTLLIANRLGSIGYSQTRRDPNDVDDGTNINDDRWLAKRASIHAAALAGNGEVVVVGSKQYVRVGRLDMDQVPPAYSARGTVHALALNYDGTRLAGCFDNRVTVWDSMGGQLHEYDGHNAAVTAIAFRPDGTAVASAGLDNAVLVWSPDSGAVLARYDWGLGPVHAIAFSPDGSLLAVAGDGGLIVFDSE